MQKMEPMQDCFAYHRMGLACECLILTSMVCKEKQCMFYKTLEEYKKGGASRRNNSLVLPRWPPFKKPRIGRE